MKKVAPAASPDAYVAALNGWRRTNVEALRATVRAASPLEEVVKWGHLVYLANGPVLLIRAEEDRVLFGFWRGQRLSAIHRAHDGASPDAAGGRTQQDTRQSDERGEVRREATLMPSAA